MSLPYFLNNTRSSLLLRLVEASERTRPTVSLHAPGGPALAYEGYPAGELNILRLVCDLRDGEHRRTGWQEYRPERADEPDIVLHGVHRDAARSLAARASHPPLICPFRVHLVVGTESTAHLSARLSKREKTSRRRLERAADWQLERTTDAGRTRDFYTTMYLPTMAERHGEAQRTESWKAARAILSSGALYEVHRDGQWIAGALCTEQGEVLTTRLLGVKGGDQAHYEVGALKMLYFLLLDEAARNPGLELTDLYGTEAMIAKGIFQWKRRLGAFPVLPETHWRWKRLVWEIRRDSPAVRDLLQRSPLLLMRGDGFQPVYFYDDTRPVKHSISSKCPGLPPAEEVHLDQFFQSLSSPPEGSRSSPTTIRPTYRAGSHPNRP